MSDSIAVAGSFINSLKICLTDYKYLSYHIFIETEGNIMTVKIHNDTIQINAVKLMEFFK